ncbi:Nn.00g001400.m01.CDS01 [Neocucurbitaria sp. VM-36]
MPVGRALVFTIRGVLSVFTVKPNCPQFFYIFFADLGLLHCDYAEVPQRSEENCTVPFGQMLNAYFTILNGFHAITAGISNDTARFSETNLTFAPKRKDNPYDTNGPFI